MPDESTIRKLTRRCGPELIEALNRELLAAAQLRGEVDMARVRVDTTVVEADIMYPTDSGLLTAAVCRIASRLRRLTSAGVKLCFVDRTSAARALQHSIGCGCAGARTKPKRRCWRSPVSSPTSPSEAVR